MPMGKKSGERLAVLIDAENISPRFFGCLESTVGMIGCPLQYRLYVPGDRPLSPGWRRVEAFGPCLHIERVPEVRAGKNSVDIALAVDAIDLAYRHDLTAIALATGDGDFVPLVHRLRQLNVRVWGIGHGVNPQLYQSVDAFVPLHRCDRMEMDRPTREMAVAAAKEMLQEHGRVATVDVARRLGRECPGWGFGDDQVRHLLTFLSAVSQFQVSDCQRFIEASWRPTPA